MAPVHIREWDPLSLRLVPRLQSPPIRNLARWQQGFPGPWEHENPVRERCAFDRVRCGSGLILVEPGPLTQHIFFPPFRSIAAEIIIHHTVAAVDGG